MIRVEEVRTKEKPNCPANPETVVEFCEDTLLVKLRTSNGHTVQFDSLSYLVQSEQLCREIRRYLVTPKTGEQS